MLIKSTQKMMRIIDIRDRIIILEKNIYVKILKVNPINFNLKSNFEKEKVLNQYNQFLKICNFDFQIIIKTKKEKIQNHVNYIKNLSNENNENTEKYIEHINNLINSKYVYSKQFYIIYSIDNSNKFESFQEILNQINTKYLLIKENLMKCGNIVTDFSEYDNESFIRIVSLLINEKESKYEIF